MLLRGFPKEFGLTSEAIIVADDDYFQAVSKLIVREISLKESEQTTEKEMLIQGNKSSKTCDLCDKISHISKNC